ncbi:MAG TPA: Smr/MutS family protein [Vicinamibacterales bacterium]
MHAGLLRSIELERVLEAVRSFALTPFGVARLTDLQPAPDRATVARRLAETTEGVRFADRHGRLPLRAAEDLPHWLEALASPGQALEPLFLVGIVDFLESVALSCTAIKGADSVPLLGDLAARTAGFTHEMAGVRRAIAPTGEVLDDASPRLRALRERLRRQRAHLRETLESFLRGRDSSRYLQEQVITDRNGRYVLVVKSEHRGSMPGIVHGASTSGASVFVEPMATVEINNEVVALGDEEAEEIHRILLELSDRFRERMADVRRTVDAAGELDEIQAKAQFARLTDACAPELVDAGFELRSARHPLLMTAVLARTHTGAETNEDANEREARRREPVPVDLLLEPPDNVLVITGPNTGGKTVAIKTVGLLAAMAQCGLHVPAADGARLPVFRMLAADIGDEQSIEANLSTFSWHVTNIAGMDRDLILPALVLLDEVGAGTDPVEGGALGVAMVDHFRRRGATVVATTHYDAMKTYAATTDGVQCAAFGFDPENFAPSYRLHYGSPGRSLALEMAARLQLNPEIVAAARANLDGREAQLAEHLARIDAELKAVEAERQAFAARERSLDQQETRVRLREDAVRQREEVSRRKLNEQLEERLRAARREVDTVIDDLKRRTSTLVRDASRRTAALSTGDAGSLRAGAMKAIESAVETRRDESAAAAEAAQPRVLDRPPAPGDRVAVGALGLEGRLVSVHAGAAEVDVRGKRLRARLQDLRPLETATGPREQVRVHVELQPRETVAMDLNVIGCTVDEALGRAERFLDETLLTDQRTVRVIHGYGTGQLRKALAGFLREHPLVMHFASAAPEAGGGGVTVVELKD